MTELLIIARSIHQRPMYLEVYQVYQPVAKRSDKLSGHSHCWNHNRPPANKTH